MVFGLKCPVCHAAAPLSSSAELDHRCSLEQIAIQREEEEKGEREETDWTKAASRAPFKLSPSLSSILEILRAQTMQETAKKNVSRRGEY